MTHQVIVRNRTLYQVGQVLCLTMEEAQSLLTDNADPVVQSPMMELLKRDSIAPFVEKPLPPLCHGLRD